MLREQNARIGRECSTETQAQPAPQTQRGDRLAQLLAPKPHLVGNRMHFCAHRRIYIVQRHGQRHRQVVLDGHVVEDDGTFAEDAEAIERVQPAPRILDGGGGTAEHAHLARIGHGRSGDQIDEDFGGGAIETEQRDRFTFADVERAHTQRTERVIVLLDVAQLDGGAGAVRHARPRRGAAASRRPEATRHRAPSRATDRRGSRSLR